MAPACSLFSSSDQVRSATSATSMRSLRLPVSRSKSADGSAIPIDHAVAEQPGQAAASYPNDLPALPESCGFATAAAACASASAAATCAAARSRSNPFSRNSRKASSMVRTRGGSTVRIRTATRCTSMSVVRVATGQFGRKSVRREATEARLTDVRRHPRSGAVRAQLVRTAVLEIYEEVRREGARADQALQRVLRREKQLRSVERRAVSDAVYGLLRLQGRVDHLLAGALRIRKQSLDKLATPTQHLLRYAAYLIAGERQSASSAVGLAGPEVAPWQWALELIAEPQTLAAPADPLEALAAETSLPRWLAKLWSEQLGAGETRALAAALNQRAPLTVRANLLKNTRDELIATLRAEGSRVEPTRLSPWGVIFTGRTNVFSLRAFKGGLFEVQDEGSQLIALACEAR